MISLRLRALSWFSRTFVKRWLARVQTVPELRDGFERHARRVHQSPAFADYRNGVCGDVPVKWVSCGPIRSDSILLYAHGGGFVAGSPETHQHMVAYLCRKLKMQAVMPRYRLAPEHPFPAGLDDVIACYQGLLAKGYRPEQIIFGGDSAGGGLVWSLMAHICAEGRARPACIFALSPLVDFTHSGDSITAHADTEAVLVAERAAEMDGYYLRGAKPDSPLVSPLFADFPECPPALFHVADQEILRDDTLNMQRHLLNQGAEVLVRSWAGGFHVWHIMLGYVPEAKAALDDVAAFIRLHRLSDDS